MSKNGIYNVLVLTSDPETIQQVTDIAKENFEHVTVIFWEYGNFSTKPDVLQQIKQTDFNLIISYINGIILKRHHLDQAEYGAVNIHPAPPEHGGAWGAWCQPVICRDVRTHHGVTVHEMDEEIDHGPIYMVERWEVGEDETIQSVFERSFQQSLKLYEQVCQTLSQSKNGSKCFTELPERWHPTNRHHTIEDVRKWFSALDPSHPAHTERVWMNHPRGIGSPPYFDDL